MDSDILGLLFGFGINIILRIYKLYRLSFIYVASHELSKIDEKTLFITVLYF